MIPSPSSPPPFVSSSRPPRTPLTAVRTMLGALVFAVLAVAGTAVYGVVSGTWAPHLVGWIVAVAVFVLAVIVDAVRASRAST